MMNKLIVLLLIITTSIACITCVQRTPRRQTIGAGEKCNVTFAEAYESLQKLFMIGDPDMILPKNECEVLEHCDKIEHHALKKLEFLKCIEQPVAKTLYTLLSHSFIKEYGERCSNEEWRKKYVKFATCVRNGKAARDINQCAYRVHEMFKYAVDNYPKLEQLPLGCCGVQMIEQCIYEKLIADCSDDDAEFGPTLLWGPIYHAFIWSCPGLDSLRLCRKHFPKEMKYFLEIIKDETPLTPRNFMRWGFQMHFNRDDVIPHPPDGKEDV